MNKLKQLQPQTETEQLCKAGLFQRRGLKLVLYTIIFFIVISCKTNHKIEITGIIISEESYPDTSILVINKDTLKFVLKDDDSIYSLNRLLHYKDKQTYIDTLYSLNKENCAILELINKNTEFLKSIESSYDVNQINKFLLKKKVDSLCYLNNKPHIDSQICRALFHASYIINLDTLVYLKHNVDSVHNSIYLYDSDPIAFCYILETVKCYKSAKQLGKNSILLGVDHFKTFMPYYFTLTPFLNQNGILQYKKRALSILRQNSGWFVAYHFRNCKW